ncbi:hypothetical protein V5799_031677 [Amblyomma americanum]|uniref:Uncharacterized protein n=1 Tax=Amblyomma americanum TaxID=6943 RepID=A0AAQ4DTC4_AMBAM
MDRTRYGRSWDSSTATTTTPTSSTSLSQDTDEILSSWHRFLEGCSPAEQRRAMLGAKRLGYGSALLPTSSRYAGLRQPSAFFQPEELPTREWTSPVFFNSSSSDCDGKDESDVSRVSLGWSVCYAVTVLLTALFALSTAVVLVQLIPASAVSPPHRVPLGAALSKGEAFLENGVRRPC